MWMYEELGSINEPVDLSPVVLTSGIRTKITVVKVGSRRLVRLRLCPVAGWKV
jgi:hypothetical protein